MEQVAQASGSKAFNDRSKRLLCCRRLPAMSLQIAVAMIERQGRWLLQLRDDIEGIVHPGTWGLFGGHLDPGETPEQGLRRELEEEISWVAGDVRWWFEHQEPHRTLHLFHVPLLVPLEALELREGQDMVLAHLDELRSGAIWSPKRREHRPLAPSLRLAVDRLEREAAGETSGNAVTEPPSSRDR